MCYGHVDLKHLARGTEVRLAQLPRVDVAVAPGAGLLVRFGAVPGMWRAGLNRTRGGVQR